MSRNRWLVVVATLLLLAALLLWLLRRPPAAAHEQASARAAARAPSRFAPPPAGATSDDEAPELSTPGHEPPEVQLDRERMCVDEGVRVTITPREEDASWLIARTSLGGEPVTGLDMVVHPSGTMTQLPDGKESALRADHLVVELIDVRSSQVVSRKRVPFALEPCRAEEPTLTVRCGKSADGPDMVECSAASWRPLAGPTLEGDAWRPAAFTWSIVSGAEPAPPPETTSIGRWRFARPPGVIRRIDSDLIVEVSARDRAGVVRKGRGSVSLHNLAFESASATGELPLVVDQDVAPTQEGQAWRLGVRLTNPFPEDVAIRTVKLSLESCSHQVSTSTPDPASQLGGHTTLAAGERISFETVLPVDAARCSARIDVEGQGVSSGHRAFATWVMQTDLAEARKLDGFEQHRLEAALKILSRRRGKVVTQVSQWELDALVREGAIPPLPQRP